MKKVAFEIGGVRIGGGAPVSVQTMCNTDTRDIAASVTQCREMAAAGADIIRLTTQGLREVEALRRIKAQLRSEGIMTPLVADVHFSANVALAAAEVADKVRINPGNFAPVHEEACSKFSQLLDKCREHGTAIRIGLNHGSLGTRITELYGNTPFAMKEAVMEWLQMCIEKDFHKVVISLKASNTRVMTDAYRLLYEEMEKIGRIYPLHLGVTEAGNGDEGRIKSAVGISALLSAGIGDTIRVSLTENPVNEIAAGKEIVKSCQMATEGPVTAENWNDWIIRASCKYGPALLDCKIDDIDLTGATIAGKPLSTEKQHYFRDLLMQASRRKFTRPEYIACPGCGRTQYNLEETFNEVKRRTSHLKGLRIAIMGCIVNGPGEMADADWGYVGEGGGKVTLYRGKTPVMRSVPQEEAIDKLLELIEKEKE
ncbi:MAG: (E)-4-hydroxy-3-methylbut-2-enyl-diphosphate synthase [Bacteroidales bacterium]|nr:(E)-4-hydroxy-3-methylbut-2-enyl-diphosphate synthase [Bacteroidales bacterium]HKM12328.1 (E)-4-hydroxy-3-methylbut-2-enyl-diphosphate synthase [Bacteroidales bacterium]